MGKAIIVFNVPEIHMKDLRERLENEVINNIESSRRGDLRSETICLLLHQASLVALKKPCGYVC
jgi:hypothetical protein